MADILDLIAELEATPPLPDAVRDVVERLRGYVIYNPHETTREAADLIERLAAENKKLGHEC